MGFLIVKWDEGEKEKGAKEGAKTEYDNLTACQLSHRTFESNWNDVYIPMM